MPKPAQKKQRTFNAQVPSALAGVRIVTQTGCAENEPGTPEPAKTNLPAGQPEVRLVAKLIDFLKTMD